MNRRVSLELKISVLCLSLLVSNPPPRSAVESAIQLPPSQTTVCEPCEKLFSILRVSTSSSTSLGKRLDPSHPLHSHRPPCSPKLTRLNRQPVSIEQQRLQQLPIHLDLLSLSLFLPLVQLSLVHAKLVEA